MSIMVESNLSTNVYKKKSRRHKFVFSRFISGTIAFGVLHTSLICCVLIQYFKDSGMLPFQLSIIIVSRRILRLFCDTIFGLIFDRFGAKIVFILGRFLKLVSYFILLLFPTFEGFILAMLLDGASYSSIYGKISSYIYNNLSVRKKIKLFPRAMSIYYFCTDASISLITLTAGFLLKLWGYNVVIYISILTNIFSLILLIRLIPSGKTFKRYQSKTFKDIFLTLKNIVEQKKEFFYLIGLYGVLSFLAWQFHSISSLVLLDMKLSSFDVALCGSILKAVMAIGALMSIIFFSKGAKLYNCVLVLLSVCLLGVISAFFYNKHIFYTFCLLVALFYTVIEVSIERKFEFYSDKTVRGTAVSIAMTFCSLLSIISNLIVGFIAQKYSYRTALIVLMLTIMLMIICLSTKLFFDKNQKEVQK